MEQHSLDYVEDVTSGILAMARVRNAATVPFSTHYTDLYQIASLRAADVVVGDIHDCGGFIGTMKLIAQCEAFNLGFWFHSSNELGVSLAAMMQIIAASPHIVHPSQTIVGLLADDVITEPFRFRKGAVELPKKPGLGVELDRNKLDKYSKLYVDSGEFGFHEPDSRRQGRFPQISGI
jgi:glucarate dehydratase